jgi:hypothetical protein
MALLMLAQGFVQVGIVGYYYMNKKAIAEKLCVNRNNPSVHCNGKCFLSQQLNKAEEQEKKQSETLVKEKGEMFSQIVSVNDAQLVLPFVNQSLLTPYSFSYSSVHSLPLVHPPCTV